MVRVDGGGMSHRRVLLDAEVGPILVVGPHKSSTQTCSGIRLDVSAAIKAGLHR